VTRYRKPNTLGPDLRKLSADARSTAFYDQPGNRAFWVALADALDWAADEIDSLRQQVEP
jgi:hypothetical protein